MMKEDLFNDIIIKFLNGDATGHEKRMLSNWLKEDPRREELFYEQLSRRESENPQYFPDVDTKASIYQQFLSGDVERIPLILFDRRERQTDSSSGLHAGWWLAASIVLLISTISYLYSDFILYETYAAGKGSVREITLKDGSTVTLNANSSIKVPRAFMGSDNREVWIEGEAFFEVTRKRDLKKFIVHTSNFDVEVLGTKFNINDRRCRSEVILAEGKIKLIAKDQEPLILKPGEQVSLSNSQKYFQRRIADPEKYEAWRNNMLIFENTPLSEVSAIIEDYYGVEMIVMDSLLRTRQFTGRLPNDDLNVILLALSASYNIEVEQRGEKFILRNKSRN